MALQTVVSAGSNLFKFLINLYTYVFNLHTLSKHKGAFGFDGHGSVRFSGSSDSQRETDDGVKRTVL
jgi:hypothetical protein